MNAPTLRRICAHKRFVVRLEHDPLRAAIQTLLDVKREPADRNVFVFVGQLIGAAQRARAPDDAAEAGKERRQLIAERIQHSVFRVGEIRLQALRAVERSVQSGRRFPHAALGIGARHHPGDNAAGHKGIELAAELRIGLDDTRKIERGIARLDAGQVQVRSTRPPLWRRRFPCSRPRRRRIHDEHRAAFGAVDHAPA